MNVNNLSNRWDKITVFLPTPQAIVALVMFTCFFVLRKNTNNLGKVLGVERGLDNSKLLPCMLSEFGRKALH